MLGYLQLSHQFFNNKENLYLEIIKKNVFRVGYCTGVASFTLTMITMNDLLSIVSVLRNHFTVRGPLIIMNV